MDLFSFLATIILVTSVVTLVVALAAYVAYKIRDVRKPAKKKRSVQNILDEPIFLKPLPNAMLQDLKQTLARSKSAQSHTVGATIEQMRRQRKNMPSPANQHNHP